MPIPRIGTERTALLIVDIQERLLPVIDGAERLVRRSSAVIAAAREFALPIFLTEQYPKGLGHTVSDIVDALDDAYAPIEKTAFSACGADGLLDSLDLKAVRSVLLVGIEAHVCVLQTALDLLERGFQVFAVADAISSRHADDRALGIDRMRQCGAILVSTEMLLFELLKTAKDPRFKTLQALIK